MNSLCPETLLLRHIGLKIHAYLFENELSAESLAFKSGIARSTIREIIAGRTNPRLLTLRAIAKAMDYSSIGEFLRSQDDK